MICQQLLSQTYFRILEKDICNMPHGRHTAVAVNFAMEEKVAHIGQYEK